MSMVCKDCLIWKRELEEATARKSRLDIEGARLLGSQAKDKALAGRLSKALNDVYSWLDWKQRKLIEIGDMDCRDAECILCGLKYG